MKISIITPTRNSEAIIGIFLQAISIQEISHDIELELLVCDDHSTDHTEKIIREKIPFLLERSIQVKLSVNERNMGIAFTTERLFDSSSGDVIVFIDSDVIPLNPRWLSLLTEEILAGDRDVVQGDFWSQYSQGTFISQQHERWRKSIYLKRFQDKEGNLRTISTRNMACRRTVLEKIKSTYMYILDPWAKKAGGDTDLGFKIRKAGYRIHLNELAKAGHKDPSTLIGLLKQKIRHGFADGSLGIRYKNNFYHSIYYPLVNDKVSLLFSIPITTVFSLANWLGLLKRASILVYMPNKL